MGIYLNPGSEKFQTSLRSEIYVDKSELIAYINSKIRTEQKYICVSRPRRFGKSMAFGMLAAYYGCEEDTDSLFMNLNISKMLSYQEHRNKYDVIAINMQAFLTKSNNIEEMLSLLQMRVIKELRRKYQIEEMDTKHLDWAMEEVFAFTNHPFIILIDEWDCIFREYKDDINSQKKYLDFLRLWLKDQDYVGLAYMTGILPIKKYGTHSALNMFGEYSMAKPKQFASYFGFTEDEVKELCMKYQMNFLETKAWYDGYHFDLSLDTIAETDEIIKEGKQNNISVYSPKSVVEAMLYQKFDNYWNQTETYEALKAYIQMNYDGLKDSVIKMLSGGSVKIRTGTFANDMTTFNSKDDVLTLLVHLGYLTYNAKSKMVSIPNKEVREEYRNAINVIGWNEVMRSINASQNLLQSLWDMDEASVAQGIERVHQEVSILQYNDENALSYTIGLAFYAAREYYMMVRELPAGKGYADICMIPYKLNHPAIIIELKWDQSVQGAIAQIKEKQYIKALEGYSGEIMLVGINYDRKSKTHECRIESLSIS